MAISSDLLPARWRRSGPWARVVLYGLLSLVAGVGEARVFVTVDEALELAFPGCAVERRTVFLTEAQLEQAYQLIGIEIESAVVHPYVAVCENGEGGVAYFDTHVVRTLEEILMVAVDHEQTVRRIEILTFREPPEYIPRAIWYQQFVGRRLDHELQLKRQIRSVSGATLTARATTDAVRRVLAIHRVLTKPAGESSP